MTTAEPPLDSIREEPPRVEAEAAPLTPRSDEADAARPGFRLGVAVALVGVAFALYLVAPEGIVQEAIPALLAAMVAQMAPLFISRRFDPFSPANYQAMISGVSLIAIVASCYANGEINYGGMPRLGYDERVSLLRLISLAYVIQAAGYCVGYYFTGGFRGLQKLLPSFPNFHWHPRRMWIAAAVLWVVFLVAYSRFQSLAGGSLDGAATAETKAVWRNEDDRMAWLFRALQLGMVPLYVLTARYIARSASDRARWKWMVGLLAVTAGIAVLGSRIGQRGYTIFMIIGLAGIVHYTWRRIPTPLILGSAFVAIVAMNYLGAVRVNEDTTTTKMSSAITRPAEVLARLEDDRDHLATMGTAMYFFPDRVDYLKGQSFLNIALAPIPRAIWPDKNQYIGWSENGIVWLLIGVPAPMPFPFVLYANFGWIGMFIGMALWGAWHKTIFNWVHGSKYQPAVVAIYATTLVAFTPTSSGIAAFLGAGLPIFIIMKLMKRA